MKIALLTEKYTPDLGGLAISTARLAGLLTSAGHAVRVYAPTPGLIPSEQRTLAHNGIAVTRFGAHKRPEDTLVDWFELLVREHARDPFDVIHAYFLTQAGFTAVYAGNYLSLPSVVSARGNDLERAVFDPARAAHILFAIEHAGAVTTNARELARKARALVPGQEVTVIPNGVDSEQFRPMQGNLKLLQHLGFKQIDLKKTAIIGFAGELRQKKGLLTLLHGYTKVAEKRSAVLLIAGEVRAGQDKKTFDHYLSTHPEANIMVTGMISPSDLRAHYALMDVFVQPSLRDGLPNALLEAMACGKAVLATRAGGIPDAVSHLENGVLVDVEDESAFTAALESLLNHPEDRARYGRAARDTAVHNFSLSAEREGNLAVYRRLGLKV